MARNRYLSTIRKWNWEAIHEEAMGTLEDDPENPGQRVGRSFLGTVFGLTPSGKYYQPWACGNVAPCPRCKGSGRAKRAVACEWCGGSGWRSLAHLAEARGESVEATVVFLGNQDHPVRINHRDGLFACSACNATGLRHNDCNWCSGTGSREAYLDEEWREALEKVAGQHGMFIESGVGDPCDLFAAISVEVEEPALAPVGEAHETQVQA